jgi:hypothetical protein
MALSADSARIGPYEKTAAQTAATTAATGSGALRRTPVSAPDDAIAAPDDAIAAPDDAIAPRARRSVILGWAEVGSCGVTDIAVNSVKEWAAIGDDGPVSFLAISPIS